ncbi:MAG TPA: hypothetical protein VG291_14580 [Xanthobacteraceae bacterium]|jgi:hypothetical protein|nr:hypothetical protein [Xanthobacteraceae bacterium]
MWLKRNRNRRFDHEHFFDVFFSGKFPNFVSTRFGSKGFLGGFQAGANWQSGAVVGGLEIDLSGTDITGSKSSSPLLQHDAGCLAGLEEGQSSELT